MGARSDGLVLIFKLRSAGLGDAAPSHTAPRTSDDGPDEVILFNALLGRLPWHTAAVALVRERVDAGVLRRTAEWHSRGRVEVDRLVPCGEWGFVRSQQELHLPGFLGQNAQLHVGAQLMDFMMSMSTGTMMMSRCLHLTVDFLRVQNHSSNSPTR